MQEARSATWLGSGYAFFAYFAWGVSPLFWKQLGKFPASSILGFRVSWSCGILLVLGLLARSALKRGLLALREPKLALLAGLATVLIAINWFTYIWAVGANRVLEASLGYYLNPLGNILIGVLFFREKLTKVRWFAFGLALLAVSILLFAFGSLPWISLVLASSFAFYGMLKKIMGLDAAFSLGLETFLLLPLAFYMISKGVGWGSLSLHEHLLFLASGFITLLPLFAFGKAAKLLPYSTLGFFQYIAPTLQLLCAVFVFNEPFDSTRATAFLLIWLSLIVISAESLRRYWYPATRKS